MLPEKKKEGSGFLLNDSLEGQRKVGANSGLVSNSEAGLGEAGIN